MNPLVRLRLRHPKELSLHLLARILFQVSQDEEQLVGRRWERTGFIRTVAAARAGLPIDGAVLHIGRQRVLERGQQRREFWLGQPRQRP